MASIVKSLIGRAQNRRAMRRWTKLAEQADKEPLSKLRSHRSQAKLLRRQLDRLIFSADS